MCDSDLSTIPTDEIRSALRDTVENCLKSKKYKISVSSASKAGEGNFIGIVCRVSFWKEDDDNNNPNEIKPTKLILKFAPQNTARRENFMSRNCFLREMYMYNVVLPYLREFEESKGLIVEENGFHEYPKCYRTVDTEMHESVFLEDLSQRSFDIINKSTEAITADHVNMVMQVLAKYHAISLALNDQQPEKFKELTSVMPELFIRRDDKFFRTFFGKQAESALEAVSAEEDAHLKAKLTKLFEKHAIDIAGDCLDESAAYTGSVIGHGDTWQNNLMFRHDQNRKPLEINVIDWQIARRCSPIIDIVYFMFICTTKELRDAHYDDFLRTYHKTLSEHIERLGSDPEKLFSFEMMQDHFRKFAKFGLIMSTCLLPMITSDGGKAVDMDEMSEALRNGEDVDGSIFESKESRNRLLSRLRGVVIDMARLNYI